MDNVESGGGGGQPVGPASSSPTRDEVKAQIEASEARTDAKLAALIGRIDTGFAEIRGELRVVQADVRALQGDMRGMKDDIRGVKDDLRGVKDDLRFVQGDLRAVQNGTAGVRNTVVITGVTLFLGLAAILVGTLAYGSAAFYNGTVIRDMIEKR